MNPTVLPLMMLLVIVLLGLSGTNAHIGGERVCGSRIDDVMMLICEKGFNSHFYQKRSSLNLFDYEDRLVDQYKTDDEDAVGQVIRPHYPNSLMATRRGVRGIVDECCIRATPCSYFEFQKYCRK